jgi:NACHT domain
MKLSGNGATILVNFDNITDSVLTDAIAAVGRLLRNPVAMLRSDRRSENLEIVMWFDNYRVTGKAPALPDLTPPQAEQLAEVLRSNEVHTVLLELLAARLTDASKADVLRVRAVWEKTFSLAFPEIVSAAETLFEYFDGKIREMVGYLKTTDPPILHQIRDEGMDTRIVAVLNAIEHHRAALSARSGRQAEEGFTVRYRRQAIDHHGKIEPPDFERRRRIPITDIFVPTTIYEGLNSDRNSDRLRQLSLWQLAGEMDRTVLVGDPGAGKTTAANVLAHYFAGEEVRPVPFVVTLRDFASEYPIRHSIVEHIEETLKVFYQCPAPPGQIDWLLVTGRALVIFDGLDELLDTSRRADVSTRVERFCTEYPHARVLVTSRVVGYDQARLDDRQFSTYQLSGFDNERVKEYTYKWFAQEPDIRDAQGWASSFLKESNSIPDLRANPLLLSLLCILYRGEGSLPRRRTEVYEQCAKLLFDKWDARRKIHQELRARHLIEPALRHLAWWLFTREQTQSVVTERALINETSMFLHRRGFESELEAKAAAVEFVEFCRGRMWVFSDAGTTATGEILYAFTHRTFLEYFAAARLAYDSDSPELLAHALAPRIARGSWDVVAELAIQIKDRTSSDGARRIYATLLSGPDSTDNTIEFLATCLHSVDPSPEMVRKLTRLALKRLFSMKGFSSSEDSLRNSWPQSLIWLVTCGIPCRVAVADEIAAEIASRVDSSNSVARVTGLRLAAWLPQVLPSNYQSAGNPEWQFWNDRRNDIIYSHAVAISEAAEADGGMRCIAVKSGFLTLKEALEMPLGLLTIFQSYDATPCPVSWPPYLEEAFQALLSGWPSFGAEVIVDDFAAVGNYLLRHSEPPWISGTIGFWDNDVENRDVPAVDVVAIDSQPQYLGAAAILSILAEKNEIKNVSGWDKRKLGPLMNLYPYIVRRQDPRQKHKLLDLPLPDEFKRIFRSWAGGRINLVGAPTTRIIRNSFSRRVQEG